MEITQPLRVGIGGPVGSGKTALTLALCRALRDRYELPGHILVIAVVQVGEFAGGC